MASLCYKLDEFLQTPHDQILGRLAGLYGGLGFSSLLTSAIDAWREQLPILHDSIKQLLQHRKDASGWHVLLEYVLPMRDRRPDAVILAAPAVFVLEFKVGAASYDAAARWQVQSYALDLRDFHPGCTGRPVVPILVATDAPGTTVFEKVLPTQLVESSLPVTQTNRSTLGACLCLAADVHCLCDAPTIDAAEWTSSRYSPTPSIIEAAQALFGGHQVEDISHAFSDSLEVTSRCIVDAIEHSQQKNCRTICFVTGIPGSGKTLVGLNAVHSPALLTDRKSSAVFLSGNGPLVKVVREALAREQVQRGVRKGEASRVASSFIANVHGFVKLFGIDRPGQAPAQNAIVFDEAQRAWSANAVEKAHGVACSEPAMVLSAMERAEGWAAVVALVGGGQEINNGEAGIEEWGRALASRPVKWRVLVSPEALGGGVSVAGQRLFPQGVPENVAVVPVSALHLNVSVRSHRAQFIGEWVNQTLSMCLKTDVTARVGGNFPVVCTRELSKARRWLHDRQERQQRTGLLASSGAIRLRAHGLELSSTFRRGISYADWFLNPPGDVRSSYQLEIAATEFDCQGLEIDWAGVCWGGDYVVDPTTGQWACWRFAGNSWRRVSNAERCRYIVNKYRVLLTRARRGMVIWVPSASDTTREATCLDATAQRLQELGIQLLE